MKKLLLTLLGALMVLPVLAREVNYTYDDTTLTYTILDEEAKTCETKAGSEYRAGNNVEGSVTIPSEITDSSGNTYSVVALGKYAFEYCSGLTSVTIPNSVTSIGEYAFEYCSRLTKAEFSSIEHLCSINFGNEYSNPLYCAQNLYINGEEVKELVIPETVTSIGSFAFSDCIGLTSVTIPNSVTSIGKGAFKYCRNLTSVTIPNSVTSIGSSAFYGCSELTRAEFSSIEHLCSIEFGDSDSNPLYYVHSLYINGEEVKELVIPETVTSIGSFAFSGCSGLTSVTIPNSVTSIGSSAFSRCSGLTSVTIPNSVTSIGRSAFKDCSGLTSVTIGNSVTSIGSYAFSDCSGLTSVTIPNSVTSIGSSAFEYCRNLTSVTIPNSVTSIGESAFIGCSGLTSMTIPNSVTSIGYYAFEGCSGLTKAEFSSIKHLCSIKFGDSCSNPLYYAHSLYINGEEVKELVIPETVTSIGESAFIYCSGLTSVTIGNSVTSIGKGAFEYCRNLTSVTIGNSVTSIGSSAFYGCRGLTSLELSDGIIPYEDTNGAFSSLKLESLYLGRPIETQYFSISNLRNLTIGNTITEVDPSMWAYATELTSLTLGNSLTSIGENAFKGCSALEEVVVPPSVETIGDSAFSGNTALKTITMGHNVKEVGENAFNGCQAENIYITAPEPPTAYITTFSNYSGMLWLPDDDILDEYYDAPVCWDRFDSQTMVVPTEIEFEGSKNITGEKGDTFQLSATLMPADVTLPQIFWRSTNPEVATVDNNGLITLQASSNALMTAAEGDDDESGKCTIIAESLYAHGPVLEVQVNNLSTDIEEIFFDSDVTGNEIDFNAPMEIFTINGIRVNASADSLEAGFYIVRQGKNVKKIAVK